MAVLSLGLPGFRRGAESPSDIDGSECTPDEAGLTTRDVEAIWGAVRALYRSGAHPAITLCLRRRGRIVLNRALGYAQGNGPRDARDVLRRPMSNDLPVCLFSASKAVTAALTHKLAEQGGIDLDRPVSHYLPRFGCNGKAAVTVADVLSHRGGFASLKLPRRERNVGLLADRERILQLICAAPVRGAGRPGYHALTGGFVLAALIEQVTGLDFRDYHHETLRKPLGMRHFTYGLPPAERGHAARNYVAGMRVRFPVSALLRHVLMAGIQEVVDASNDPVFMDAVVPAGNLYATAEELSRFYQMLLDGGEYAGQRVMEPATVARLLRPRGRLALDRMIGLPLRYSEGLMLGARGFSLYGPHTADAWGHLGFMNILGWGQPSRGVSAALLTTGKAVLGAHLLPLLRLLSEISSRCA